MISESFLKPIASWKNGSIPQLCIGCDVGGSGLRIRLSNFHNPQQFLDLNHIKAQSTQEALNSLENLENILKKISPSFQCKGSSIAVAGPISNNSVILTNWPGKPSVRTLSLSMLPKTLFPVNKSLFLNDLEAGAYGVIAADKEKILDSHFEQLFANVAPTGPIVSDSRTAVLAMGSGLGVALIVKTPLLNKPLVVPTELGHLQIPSVCARHPNSKEEYNLLQHVSDHHYGGRQMPEFEDISSGRGLCLVWQYYNMKATGNKVPLDQISAHEIAQNAQKGDKVSRDALLQHYLMFMRSAKSISTRLSCDSIVMALDNQVKNMWFVNSAIDQLHDEFYHFIRPDWMKNIRVYSQTKVLNFNILGTSYMAHQVANQ